MSAPRPARRLRIGLIEYGDASLGTRENTIPRKRRLDPLPWPRQDRADGRSQKRSSQPLQSVGWSLGDYGELRAGHIRPSDIRQRSMADSRIHRPMSLNRLRIVVRLVCVANAVPLWFRGVFRLAPPRTCGLGTASTQSREFNAVPRHHHIRPRTVSQMKEFPQNREAKQINPEERRLTIEQFFALGKEKGLTANRHKSLSSLMPRTGIEPARVLPH